MRELTLEDLPEDVKRFVADGQGERVVVTSGGRPVAVLIGVEGYDAEDWGYMNSPEFWAMIEQRRKEPTVRLDAIKDSLLAGE